MRGAGASLIGLPLLHAFSTGKATAQGMSPQRLVIIHHGQGTLLDQWTPASTGPDYTLSPLLEPLAAHKERMLVVSGVSNHARRAQRRGNGHNPAGRSIMSATPFTESVRPDGTLRLESEHSENGDSWGPSIDQVIASRLVQQNQRSSVHLAIGGSGAGENACWWRGAPGQTERISNEGNPVRAFDTLFSGVTFPGDEMRTPTRAERFRARSGSVLDSVARSYNALEGRVPREDRETLQRHAEQIRRLEQNLDVQVEMNEACRRPEFMTPDGYRHSDDEWREISATNMFELATIAMSCDIARVVTLQFTQYHAPRFTHIPNYSVPLPGYDNWHDMVHKQSDDAAGGGLRRGFMWYSEQVSRFIAQLASTPEGDGSLLDNTLVLWVSEFGNGGAHRTTDLPVVLFGNLGDAVLNGQHINVGDRTTNDLFLAMLQLYGGSDTSFGLARDHEGRDLVTGPLEIAV